jgi:hypothetical protein
MYRGFAGLVKVALTIGWYHHHCMETRKANQTTPRDAGDETEASGCDSVPTLASPPFPPHLTPGSWWRLFGEGDNGIPFEIVSVRVRRNKYQMLYFEVKDRDVHGTHSCEKVGPDPEDWLDQYEPVEDSEVKEYLNKM